MNTIQVNQRALREILDILCGLTQVRVTFWDVNMKHIAGARSPNVEYCRSLWEKAGLLNRCKECEEMGLQAASSDSRKIYCFHCHAGMNEFIKPVYSNNQILGYFMYGQSRLEGYPDDYETRMKMYKEFDLNVKEMELQYAQIPVRTYAYMETMGQMFDIVARYAFFSEIFRAQRASLADNIKNYIARNYAYPITMQSLCDTLFVSRSTVSHLLPRELNTTFSAMLNQTRIEKVKELLLVYPSMEYVANKTGFASANYMSRVFKRYEGISPSQYLKLKAQENE